MLNMARAGHLSPEIAEIAPAAATSIPECRLRELFDTGTCLTGPPAEADGVVLATGRIGGQPAVGWAHDPAHKGGSLGSREAELVVRALAMAEDRGVPVVGLVDSAGARIQDGAAALTGYAEIFGAQARASVPQISIICGTCAGGGAYSPALGDLTVATERDTRMFLTGPRVVERATGERIDAAELGGARIHARNGVAHVVVADVAAAADATRRILEHLPRAVWSTPERHAARPPIAGDPAAVLPASARMVYDIRDLASRLLDGGELLELAPRWAANLVVGLARLDGHAVGVVANQPRRLGGTLDAEASDKGAWFVGFCDRFRLPLVVLVDTPGFLPGAAQERAAVIRRGAGLVRAWARATVPRATVTVRASFGGAHIAMNSRGLGADVTLAWPNARIGVMGARQAVEVVRRAAIAQGADADALAREYEELHLPAERAVAIGAIDDVIAPADTRARLIEALTAPRADRCLARRSTARP